MCDDGNTASGDGCDANCTATACGNGVVTAGEACDDGNLKSLDGCSALCVIEPLEVEPNEDGSISSGAPGITGNAFAIAKADANGAFTGPVVIRAAIAPVGDEDVFKLTNPTSELKLLILDTWNPALGIGVACGASTNTGLQLRDATGAVLASNDDLEITNRRIRAELIEGDRAVKSCETGITSRLTLVTSTGLEIADAFSSGRGDCSLIDGTGAQPLHSQARNFGSTPRTFYLMVREGSFSTSSSFTYRLQVSVR